jgi:hypothetical protein
MDYAHQTGHQHHQDRIGPGMQFVEKRAAAAGQRDYQYGQCGQNFNRQNRSGRGNARPGGALSAPSGAKRWPHE